MRAVIELIRGGEGACFGIPEVGEEWNGIWGDADVGEHGMVFDVPRMREDAFGA
jgi:hypothetical protein